MNRVIYIDVLIILNIYVGFFLFKGTARIINAAPSNWRYFWGSLLSGFYSVVILFDIDNFKLVVLKLIMAASLTLVVFSFHNKAQFLKSFIYFLAVNFIYGGVMMALWLFVAPIGMVYKNGTAYFDISALSLVASTIAAYLIISIICMLLDRRSSKNETALVALSYKGREAVVMGIVDTGNKLCDVFTGLPVIICEYESVREFFPRRLESYFKSPLDYNFYQSGETEMKALSKLRVIPVSSLGGEGTLAAFVPDNLSVNQKPKKAVIAVTANKLSDGDFNAVVSPSLL